MDTFLFPATIQRATATNEAQLLSLFQARAKSPDIEPFFWGAEISSNSLDTYFTRMDTTTLRNFAGDAAAGVSFLDSHDGRKIGYGRSLAGLYQEDTGEPPSVRVPEGAVIINPPTSYQRTLADFYTIPNINYGGQHSYASTNDFITAVQAGIANDVSVGFTGGRWVCDISGTNYWSWDCPFIAGQVYEVEVDGEQRQVLSTVTIKDASLVEVSDVYAGATPNAAVIRKAQQEIEAGRASPKQIRQIENRYQVDLSHRQNWLVGAPQASTKETAADAADREDFMDLEQRLTKTLGSRMKDGGNVEEAVIALVTERDTVATERDSLQEQVNTLSPRVGELEEQVKELEPQAADGKQYREDLIESAVKEGIRAHGADFAVDTYRGVLAGLSLDSIKRFKADWKALGDKQFTGGRKTADLEEQPKHEEGEGFREIKTPDAAYKG